MSNERLAMLFFDIGLVLAMISMVIGPFGITNWALTTGVVACFFGIASLCLGFLNWDDWMRPEHSDGTSLQPSGRDAAETDMADSRDDPFPHSL
ncbi:hypothetical protein EQM14_05125 [Caproiciproducens sp. NJN-50]|uniref:hypothetical protein n=1 Tax=Acutalibacteraceae TaxID=3082771 RepID=UPI000FFE0634|nr:MULTISPECIES: hypothetical protein [Acutalibacteraceae]QAT49207.1 hypothetical protein EQM14_05125 [Caproiciproducens sp. NJN-50]